MKQRHGRTSLRLQDYDYNQSGWYFVTICIKNRENLLGKICEDKKGAVTYCSLSEIGIIAHQCWQEIPEHFLNVTLDEYIVMPNHIHGIVIIENDDFVGNRHACSLQKERPHQTLPTVIGSFKSAVSKIAHPLLPKFQWQKSFYDHIIRNKKSFNNIGEYIHYNPLKWHQDIENLEYLQTIPKNKYKEKSEQYYKKLFIN